MRATVPPMRIWLVDRTMVLWPVCIAFVLASVLFLFRKAFEVVPTVLAAAGIQPWLADPSHHAVLSLAAPRADPGRAVDGRLDRRGDRRRRARPAGC